MTTITKIGCQVLLAAGLLFVSVTHGQTDEINVMSFNVWTDENTAAGRNKIVEIIQAASADIIAVQEMGNNAAPIRR